MSKTFCTPGYFNILIVDSKNLILWKIIKNVALNLVIICKH